MGVEDGDQGSFETEDLLWLQLGYNLTKLLVEEVFKDGFERGCLLLVGLLSLPESVHLRESRFEVGADSSEARPPELEVVPVEISSLDTAAEELCFRDCRFDWLDVENRNGVRLREVVRFSRF